ncbi:MAG: hypothetical protein WC960_02840 [Bacteroidales bacterium]
MDRKRDRYIYIHFLGVLILQLVLSKILTFGPLLLIALYPIFIISLPPNFSTKKLLWWAFSIGVAVDLLSGNIIGLNSAASLVLALFRNNILRAFYTKGEVISLSFINMRDLGVIRYNSYVALSLLVHHLALLLIESLTLSSFAHLLSRLAVSVLVNLAIVSTIEYAIFYRRSA